MPSSARDRPNGEAEPYFAALPKRAGDELLRLRELVHRVAGEIEGVGPLAESLKWGEPSYTPAKAGVGSSVRLAALRDGRVAMHFICHTGLVERFRELYPDVFDYQGKRSILIEPGRPLDEQALSHCVAMAMTYHRDRRPSG